MEERSEKNYLDTLGDLYALRAGISLASQQKDCGDAIMHEANDKAQKEMDKSNSVRQAKIDSKNQIERFLQEAKERRSRANDELVSYEHYEMARKSANKAWIILIVVVIAFIVLGALFLAGVISRDLGFASIIIGIVLIIASLVILRFGSDFAESKRGDFKYRRMKKGELEEHLAEQRRSIAVTNESIPKLEKQLKEYSEKVEQATGSYEEERKQIEKDKELTGKQAEVYYQKACDILGALQATYGSMLDYREWKHLDLIIYAIETRRADGIKSALLDYVDAEVRADRIEYAIEDASREICGAIQTATGEILSSMQSGIRTLSDKIQGSSQRLSGEMMQLKGQVSDQKQTLGKLASASELNTALIKKAGESSDKIMRDVQQLKKGMNVTVTLKK